MTDLSDHSDGDRRDAAGNGQQDAPDAIAAAFLAAVGRRVRDRRLAHGLSRRALSDRSSVSQRYLANLEAGIGNISIGLLKRVADALDLRIEALVAEPPAPDDDAALMAALFAAATGEDRRRALALLAPDPAFRQKGRRIALIGLRGAGKSTLGRLAATRLGIAFVELNQEIERTAGIPVTEVMALYGQEGYRRLERQIVESRADAGEPLIMAVAGGIVSEPETFRVLLAHYHTIWLKAQPDDHMGRVREQGDTRPMAGFPAAMDSLRSILAAREALYAQSDAVVDTSGRTVEESLTDLVALIAERRFIGSL